MEQGHYVSIEKRGSGFEGVIPKTEPITEQNEQDWFQKNAVSFIYNCHIFKGSKLLHYIYIDSRLVSIWS